MASSETLQARLGGRYVIERELGRGGMGTVYLARDTRLDRPVALKVLPAEFGEQSALRERFLRETRTAASFSHPNIVPVYAVEETEDFLAYAMAYVEGETLTERVKRTGPLPTRDVVRLLQDVGYALAYAHGRGVVHRDIKPDNVMIERATGRALVMDFGIARVIAAPAVARDGLTRVGEVVGTPEYMSPEQATGDHVDGRSDLYALGLTAFFAVTGQRAVTGDSTGKILAQQITGALPDIHAARPDLPAPLVEAIEKCAAKDPADRYQNAESLVEALDLAHLSGPEIPLPVRLFAQELSTLSLVLIGGFFLMFMMFQLQASGDNGDWSLLIVMLISVQLTRVLQTMREAGRLAHAGFSRSDVLAGLKAVMAERDTRRAELKADPVTRKARRRTLQWAIALLVMGLVSFRIAWSYRFQVGPNSYNVRWPGGMFVLNAMIMLGVSLALLMRSPFRAPVGERLFRLVWLGPLGRAFLRFSSRGASKRHAAAVTPVAQARSNAKLPVAAPAVAPAVASSSSDQLAGLEARVRALEKWRQESGVEVPPRTFS